MVMRVSCWFGRHDLTTLVEQGASYTVCSKCGKTPRGAERHIAHEGVESVYHGPPGNAGANVGGGGDGGAGV